MMNVVGFEPALFFAFFLLRFRALYINHRSMQSYPLNPTHRVLMIMS